ncbi:MAG: uracil phosphoribosyltransferase [Thermomicrobiales bacterium]
MDSGHDAAPMTGREQPSRDEVLSHERLAIVQNNLAQTMLGKLRDRRTDVAAFNAIAAELARLVVYEACRDIRLATKWAEGFDGSPIDVPIPARTLAGVTVLRAGLIFEPAFRLLLPTSPLYQLGLRRNEETLEPEIYATNLPQEDNWADRVLLVDPMLATGGTATAAIEAIRQHHRGRIDALCIVAAPYGVKAVTDYDRDTWITTLALDNRLNEIGYIVPGLGDAGDRYFGTI